MTPEQQFKPGDRVSMARWDKSERPPNRMGDCTVKYSGRDQCESGWMVRVESSDGRLMDLDQNWLQRLL